MDEKPRIQKLISVLCTENRSPNIAADDFNFLVDKKIIHPLGLYKNFKKLPGDARTVKVINGKVVMISQASIAPYLPRPVPRPIIKPTDNNHHLRHLGEG